MSGTEWHSSSPGSHSSRKPPAYVHAAATSSRLAERPAGASSRKTARPASAIRATTESAYVTTNASKPALK
eukprot:1786018-Prymnesium_polylepis.1